LDDLIPRFSEFVAGRLRNAGWSEFRHVESRQVIEYFTKKGFAVHPLAQQVLNNLGGVRFDLPNGGIGSLTFGAPEAVRFLTTQGIARIQELVGEPLSPVGHGGGYSLLLSPTGAAYLLHDEWFCLIKSETLDEMLFCVFTGDRENCKDIDISNI
jgi:hypothetical protein